jgi:hypothetical protein
LTKLPNEENVSSVDEEIKKGIKNEKHVKRALKFLRANREIFHFHHARALGELDHIGIDFLVCPESLSWMIPLQVKSSETGRVEHREKYGDIPCVVLDHTMNIPQLSQVILEELGLFKDSLIEKVVQNLESAMVKNT